MLRTNGWMDYSIKKLTFTLLLLPHWRTSVDQLIESSQSRPFYQRLKGELRHTCSCSQDAEVATLEERIFSFFFFFTVWKTEQRWIPSTHNYYTRRKMWRLCKGTKILSLIVLRKLHLCRHKNDLSFGMYRPTAGWRAQGGGHGAFGLAFSSCTHGAPWDEGFLVHWGQH